MCLRRLLVQALLKIVIIELFKTMYLAPHTRFNHSFGLLHVNGAVDGTRVVITKPNIFPAELYKSKGISYFKYSNCLLLRVTDTWRPCIVSWQSTIYFCGKLLNRCIIIL